MRRGHYECPQCGNGQELQDRGRNAAGLLECWYCSCELEWFPDNGDPPETQEEHRKIEAENKRRLAEKKRRNP